MRQVAFGASSCYYPNTGLSSPTVSMNNQYVIEAHIGVNGYFYSNIATVGKPYITFGALSGITVSGTGKGTSPSIALSNNYPSVVFCFINSNGNVAYKLGQIVYGTIQWHGNDYEIQYSSSNTKIPAVSCSVAINENGKVAVAYQKSNNDLCYIMGTINVTTNTIGWASSTTKYDTGQKPKIAINTSGYFLEVHQSENFNSIYYNLGKFTNSSVSWKNSGEYHGVTMSSPSATPSISMNDGGDVVEVHKSTGANANSLYYMQYKVNTSTNKLDFIYEQRYSIYADSDGMGGVLPAVAINSNGDAFQMYQSLAGSMYGCTSKIWDRSNWMSNFQTKTLGQLSIPGSHDAGMSTTHGCTTFGSSGNTQTQIKNIANQLAIGIRYFDIRPAFNTLSNTYSSNTTIYTGHFGDTKSPVGIQGCNGESMDDVLNAVKNFLNLSTSSTEVVILKFSHFYNTTTTVGMNGASYTSDYFFSDSSITVATKQTQINQLISSINSILGSKVYINNTGSRLADIALSSCKGKVIIVFDIADLSGVTLSNGIYRYLDFNPTSPNKSSADLVVFDKYSNTNDINVMTSSSAPLDTEHPGQMYLLQNSANHGGDLFLLSWTLTLSGGQASNPLAFNILQLSQQATGVLSKFMVNYQYDLAAHFPNILYVDACDGFVTDVATWINNLNLK